MSNVLEIESTRDRIIDTLVVYAIMDIGLEVDPDIRFRVSMGREKIMKVEYSNPKLEEDMISKLKEKSRMFSVANRMNFFFNVGNKSFSVDEHVCTYCTGKQDCNRKGKCGKTKILAYTVLNHYIENSEKSFSLRWGPRVITKKRSKKNPVTLIVGVSPYWSKGLRVWDKGVWKEAATASEYPVVALALYGLANYSINVLTSKSLTRLMFSPPIGKELSHLEALKFLTLVRRVVNSIYTEMERFLRLELPFMVLPLSMLCFLDVPAIYMLHQVAPSVILIRYDLDRGSPKNPRGYEELSLADTLEFYRRLGEFFWEFKRMIADLIELAMEEEKYRFQVLDILVKLALGIKNKEPSYFNDALFDVQSLRKEVDSKRYVIGREAVLAAHEALRASRRSFLSEFPL